jgi:pimeloyl-[acyl-carrier protein] methyl ester esterase
LSLVVEQSGSGPTLYLIHGWAMHGGLFEGLGEQLDDCRVARVDLPGHGRNRERPWPADAWRLADEVAELADGAWLAGWSLGGLLALMAALNGRWRPRGLALIAASPCFTRRDHWPHGVDDHLVEQMAAEIKIAPERVLARFLALEVHGSRSAAADRRVLKAAALRHGPPNPGALARGLDLLREADLSQRLDALDLPIVLIGGRRDRLIPWAALEATVAALSNGRLVAVPGAAHAPFLTRPDVVAGAIKELMHSS